MTCCKILGFCLLFAVTHLIGFGDSQNLKVYEVRLVNSEQNPYIAYQCLSINRLILLKDSIISISCLVSKSFCCLIVSRKKT